MGKAIVIKNIINLTLVDNISDKGQRIQEYETKVGISLDSS